MILFDSTSVSNVSRLLRARDNEILAIRACLPVGVTLSFETGRLPFGALPSSDGSCAGVVCAPYDAALQDVCVLKVCCSAQTMDSCSNIVLIPPLPGYFRIRLLPLGAVGTVNVFAESISYAAADIFPQRYWLGECPAAPPAPQANLNISKTSSAPSYIVGGLGSYTILATNAGPAAANGGVISDILPPSSTITVGAGPYVVTYGGGAFGPATTSFPLTVTTWPAGGTVSVLVPFTAAVVGSVGNTAIVTTPVGTDDPTLGDNSSTVTVTVTAPGNTVNLAITNACAGPTTAPISTTVDISYLSVISNSGPASAINATVTYVPTFSNSASVVDPVFITYGGGATGPASATWADLAAGIVLPSVPVGGTATLAPHMNYYGFNTNQTTVATVDPSAAQTDTNLTNNTATATCNPLRVEPCCLQIANVVVTPSPVPANTQFTVEADFVNCGSLAQLGGYATLTGLPAGVSLSLGNTVTWPGIPVIGFVHKTWYASNDSGGSVTQTATITAHGNCGSGPLVVSTPVSITLVGAAATDLAIVKSINSTTFDL